MKVEEWQRKCAFCARFTNFSGGKYSTPGKGICELKTEDNSGVVFAEEEDVCDDFKFIYDEGCKEYSNEAGTFFFAIKKYLTRGGFIKDRNGKWCKEGDKIKSSFEADKDDIFILEWNERYFCFEKRLASDPPNSGRYDMDDCIMGVVPFDLVESCKPDICKDFEEAEK